jgi:hypothetical protein
MATNRIITCICNAATAERGKDKDRISKQFNIPQNSELLALQGLQEFYPKG